MAPGGQTPEPAPKRVRTSQIRAVNGRLQVVANTSPSRSPNEDRRKQQRVDQEESDSSWFDSSEEEGESKEDKRESEGSGILKRAREGEKQQQLHPVGGACHNLHHTCLDRLEV